MEQGRRAVCHMLGQTFEPCQFMPYGLFTIPEISMVGQNEQQLTAERVPYEVGIARFGEIARGQIAGDRTGMLKLLFHRDTRKLLGVHVIGESATEIIHIGQAVMALGGTIDYFRDTVFNYPTMAECYKVAALDGLNKLSLWEEAEMGIAAPERRRIASSATQSSKSWKRSALTSRSKRLHAGLTGRSLRTHASACDVPTVRSLLAATARCRIMAA